MNYTINEKVRFLAPCQAQIKLPDGTLDIKGTLATENAMTTQRMQLVGLEGIEKTVAVYRETSGHSKPFFLKCRYRQMQVTTESGKTEVVWVNKRSFQKRLGGEQGLIQISQQLRNQLRNEKDEKTLHSIQQALADLRPAPQEDPKAQRIEALRAQMSTCTTSAITYEQAARIMEVANKNKPTGPDQVRLLATKTHNIARPILHSPEGRFVLMTHCSKGGDTLLGEGSFKKAKLAINIETGEVRAVATTKDLTTFEHETAMMRQCSTYGGVQLITAHAKPEGDKGYIVMEKCSGDLVKTMESEMTHTQKLRLSSEITGHVATMHEKGLVLCDLKPANILVREDGTSRMGDLDMVKDATNTQEPQCGTLDYMSPELVKDRTATNTQKSDAWALGCTLYKLFHPKHDEFTSETLGLKTDRDVIDFLQLRKDGMIVRQIDQQLTGCPKEIKAIIAGLLKVKPNQRMTAQEAQSRLVQLQIA